MPVDDGCLTERDAYLEQLSFAEDLCALAFEAFDHWIEMIGEIAEECAADLGPRPEVPENADPMLEDVIREQQEQYDQQVQECLEASSEILEAENQFLDLQAACEIELGTADALNDEYEACQHELESGIPFD